MVGVEVIECRALWFWAPPFWRGRPLESEELRGFEAVFDDAFLGVVALAVPVPPFRPGIGKGIGQRECECSLATSVRVAEERHEESGGALWGRDSR